MIYAFMIIMTVIVASYIRWLLDRKEIKVIDVDYVDVKQKIANIRSYDVSKN